jgi:hypothetical protein
VINALGEVQYPNSHIEEVFTATLSKYDLDKIRTQLPFLEDKDNFSINL